MIVTFEQPANFERSLQHQVNVTSPVFFISEQLLINCNIIYKFVIHIFHYSILYTLYIEEIITILITLFYRKNLGRWQLGYNLFFSKCG